LRIIDPLITVRLCKCQLKTEQKKDYMKKLFYQCVFILLLLVTQMYCCFLEFYD